ncbi:MAG: PEGA domain-containing protein [Trueperaceae bacterium]|nr:PEGA domain-containing protein [Trueperaceae bacterium]
MATLFWLALLGLLTTGLAQPRDVVISPQSIVLNPLPTFDAEVYVDKDVSGEGAPSYSIGDEIRISVTVSEDSYVYLYNVRSNGEVVQLLPNRLDQPGQNNFLFANDTKTFPPRNARYTFNVDGPIGLDKVTVIASKEELNTFELARYVNDPNFATSSLGEQGFADTLAALLRGLSQNAWVSDTALFYVGPRPETLPYGTLALTSNPSGALAFVDDRFVGYTPLRYGTLAGEHTVRFELERYDAFETTTSVRGGALQSRQAQTTPRRDHRGSIVFTSEPPGADVFVSGDYVGTTPTERVTLRPGTYQARFLLSEYEEATVEVSVSGSINQEVSAELTPIAPPTGALVVEVNVPGAVIFVNGVSYGTVAESGRGRISDLPVGEHELTIVTQGYQTFVTDFEILPGGTTEIIANPAPL